MVIATASKRLGYGQQKVRQCINHAMLRTLSEIFLQKE